MTEPTLEPEDPDVGAVDPDDNDDDPQSPVADLSGDPIGPQP